MDTQDVYLQAALALLRENRNLFPVASLANASCLIMPDDRVAPNAGRLFIGLRPAQHMVVDPSPYHLYDRVGVIVTITLRTADVPSDRVGQNRVSRTKTKTRPYPPTITEAKDHVIRTLHANNDVVCKAQQIILAEEEGQLDYPALTPLHYQSVNASGPTVVGSDHFLSGNEQLGKSEGNANMGLFLRLQFGDGQRFRKVSSHPDD